MSEYTNNITIFDPWANKENVNRAYGLDITNVMPSENDFDVIILAVSHKDFLKLDLRSSLNKNGIIYDVKGVLDRNIIDGRL